jgi:hypothetical protein
MLSNCSTDLKSREGLYRRIAQSRLAETRTDGKRLGTHASSVLGVGQ